MAKVAKNSVFSDEIEAAFRMAAEQGIFVERAVAPKKVDMRPWTAIEDVLGERRMVQLSKQKLHMWFRSYRRPVDGVQGVFLYDRRQIERLTQKEMVAGDAQGTETIKKSVFDLVADPKNSRDGDKGYLPVLFCKGTKYSVKSCRKVGNDGEVMYALEIIPVKWDEKLQTCVPTGNEAPGVLLLPVIK